MVPLAPAMDGRERRPRVCSAALRRASSATRGAAEVPCAAVVPPTPTPPPPLPPPPRAQNVGAARPIRVGLASAARRHHVSGAPTVGAAAAWPRGVPRARRRACAANRQRRPRPGALAVAGAPACARLCGPRRRPREGRRVALGVGRLCGIRAGLRGGLPPRALSSAWRGVSVVDRLRNGLGGGGGEFSTTRRGERAKCNRL